MKQKIQFFIENLFHEKTLKTCLESKEFVKNQRIWERSKWGEYRSPWPKVDYAWVDGSVPKKGSRAAPRPRAKWYRLRGWESWTRGWTTLSRFPPHSRGSPSTPWTFLLLQDRKIHDLKRGSSSSLKLRLQLFLLDHWTQQRSLLYAPSFATLAPAFFPSSSEYRSFNSHTLKTSVLYQFTFCFGFRNTGPIVDCVSFD